MVAPMPWRRPTPRRPPLSAPRGRLRAVYRLTAGMSRANLARAEGGCGAGRGQRHPGSARLPGAARRPGRDGGAARGRAPAAARVDGVARPLDVGGRRRLACGRLRRQTDAPWLPPRPFARPAVLDAQARAAAAKPRQAHRPRRARPYDPVDAALRRAASGLRAIRASRRRSPTCPGRRRRAGETQAETTAQPTKRPRRP